MLVHLSIDNFVLVERLTLDLKSGFTALTGETGAGKSILLDAIGACLGQNAERRFVRHNTEQAVICAQFEVDEDHPVWAKLEEFDLESNPDEALLLKRVIRAKGAARAYIGDRPVTAKTLSAIGSLLLEIHGQHSATQLLKQSEHRKILDTYASSAALLEKCASASKKVQAAREVREELEASAATAQARQEELNDALAMLEKVNPEEGELTQLEAMRARLHQAERISTLINDADTALTDADLDTKLAVAMRSMDKLTQLPGLANSTEDELSMSARSAYEALERARIELDEAITSLSCLSAFDLSDATALEQAEQRHYTLTTTARQLGVTVEDLPKLQAKYQEEMNTLENGALNIEQAKAQEVVEQEAWRGLADRLTTLRAKKARSLKKDIESELKTLKLEKVQFEALLTPLSEKNYSPYGNEQIEFLAKTNAGSEFAPIRLIASGGELSRFSLALKCALAEHGLGKTLIFDEADQGVGGQVASSIGQKFIQLSQSRQVFAITHSPQVASAANQQLHVAKSDTRKKETTSTISPLDLEARREEIARMLAGSAITAEARAAADRLLECA